MRPSKPTWRCDGMTPSARLQAAIEILDRWLAGTPAEKALLNWSRNSRFAGSGDRNAVRDLVFTAIRCRRSHAALGGAETGRGLILGGLYEGGADVDALFTGVGHAPAPVTEARGVLEGLAALDCPDWIAPSLQASLGDRFAPVMQAQRHRAPTFLRVNRVAVGDAVGMLAAEGIVAQPHPLASTALEVVEGARKVANSRAYLEGAVELQDAASQAVVEALPLSDGMRVLDYCAGGGGKTLAMAARARLQLSAHDANPQRMRDLSSRAARAGTAVEVVTRPAGAYDLVLADVPCSGSGSWRRSPEGKWSLTRERLDAIRAVQAEILRDTARVVAQGGCLAYVTCSILDEENAAQVDDFISQNADWRLEKKLDLTPLDGGDGFHLSVLRRG